MNKILDQITRNESFNTTVQNKKELLVDKGISLSGDIRKGKFHYHVQWTSDDNRFKVGVGKFGKEYYLNTIKYNDGHKGNNPNDMYPVIWVDDVKKEFDGSFKGIYNFFKWVSENDKKSLEYIGYLCYRNAYLFDHDKNHVYNPPKEIINYLYNHLPLYNDISVECFLHYLEMISWNEDVKYSTLGYDISKGYGRRNNLLTYVHIILVLLGESDLMKLCSELSRPPVGVAPISVNEGMLFIKRMESNKEEEENRKLLLKESVEDLIKMNFKLKLENQILKNQLNQPKKNKNKNIYIDDEEISLF